MQNHSKSKMSILIFGICMMILLIFIDQITKHLAYNHLLNNEFSVIPNVFSLTYLENHGAAFGILQGKKIFLVLVAIIIFTVLSLVYVSLPNLKKFRLVRILIVFMSAGAIGNMIDRIARGYVIDFFNFYVIKFPIFNVADIYVTVASAVLIFSMFFYYKEDDFGFSKKDEHKEQKINEINQQ